MATAADERIWDHVRRTVTPLGEPCPGPRRGGSWPGPALAVDLHGDRVHAAHARVREVVRGARDRGIPHVVVVTGRSGRIREEFPTWAALSPDVRRAEPLRGGGAFRVELARVGRAR